MKNKTQKMVFASFFGLLLVFSGFLYVQLGEAEKRIEELEAQKPWMIGNPYTTEIWPGALQSENVTCIDLYTSAINESSAGGKVKVYNLIVENGTSFPSTPAENQVFLRTDHDLLYVYNGSSWRTVGYRDHGNMTGLSDDDHPIYLLASGARQLTGDWDVGSHGIIGVTWLNATNIDVTALYVATITESTSGGKVKTFHLIVHNGTSFPSSPSSSQLFFREDEDNLYIYNGTSWVDLTAGGVSDHGQLTGLSDDDHSIYLLASGARALTDDWDVGTHGIIGVTWLNATDIDLSSVLYMHQGQIVNASFWKGTSFPSNPVEGQPFYRTDEDTFYVYNGTGWESLEGAQGPTGPAGEVEGLPASYVVFKNTTATYMVNGTTGAVDWSSTDDSAVINACIENLTSGGKIFVKSATYTLTSRITLKENIWIAGEGWTTIFQASASGILEGIFRYKHATGADCNITLANFAIDGNKASYPTSEFYGIYINRGSWIHLDKLYVYNSPSHGMLIDGDDSPEYYCSHIWITNCVFEDNGYDNSPYNEHGCYLQRCKKMFVDNCEFINNYESGLKIVLSGAGADIELTDLSSHDNICGYIFYDIEKVTLTNCKAYDNDVEGFRIFQNADYFGYSNCQAWGNEYGLTLGTAIKAVNYATILGGHYCNNTNDGINVGGASDNFTIIGTIALNNGDKNIVHPTSGKTYIVRNNIGYVTENSGSQTVADGENIAHGLVATPTFASLTCGTPTYDGEEVLVSVASVDGTNIVPDVRWINGTEITDDAVTLYWEANCY